MTKNYIKLRVKYPKGSTPEEIEIFRRGVERAMQDEFLKKPSKWELDLIKGTSDKLPSGILGEEGIKKL